MSENVDDYARLYNSLLESQVQPIETHASVFTEIQQGITAGKPKGLISIVILTFNQLNFTKECVKSIQMHTLEPHEVIFVDNGSKDGTVSWLCELVRENPHYGLIENRENLGFAKGCNQGIEAATGKYLLLLNNDVVVTEGWLLGMLECLNRHPGIGIVGPMTNQISGIQKISEVLINLSINWMNLPVPFERKIDTAGLQSGESLDSACFLKRSGSSGSAS